MFIKTHKIGGFSTSSKNSSTRLTTGIIQACREHTNKNYTKGFSLIESVIAISLGIFVAVALTTITVYGLKNAKGLKEKERLYSSANFFTQRTAYFMKQAKSFEVTPPSTLKVVLPDKTIIVEKSGSDILIEGEKVNASGVMAENLNFTPMQRSVRINFILRSGAETFSGTTTVARRNTL